MNLKIVVAYDGSSYQGSQKQPNKMSVENRLIDVFKSLNIEPKIIFSGRTDRDVHATGQVFNIQVPIFWENLVKLKKCLNNGLPNSILIKKISKADDEFHSRFHAKKRVYRYIITSKEITPFNAKYLTHEKNIDVEKIKEAIKCFEGIHDFEYFHKQGSDKVFFEKEIYEAKFYKYKEYFVFKFSANSYLRSQIRLMVGFLLEISRKNLTAEQLTSQLDKKELIFRKPAPANGLYLARVKY